METGHRIVGDFMRAHSDGWIVTCRLCSPKKTKRMFRNTGTGDALVMAQRFWTEHTASPGHRLALVAYLTSADDRAGVLSARAAARLFRD